jgi:hypothetical protein
MGGFLFASQGQTTLRRVLRSLQGEVGSLGEEWVFCFISLQDCRALIAELPFWLTLRGIHCLQ